MTMLRTTCASSPKPHGRGAICWSSLNSPIRVLARRRYLPHPMTRSWSRCLTRHIFTRLPLLQDSPWNRMGRDRKVLCCFRLLAIAFCAIRKGAEPAWCRGTSTLASLMHIPILPISIPEQRLLPAASRWGIIAGGSPSVTCSASRINMLLRC